MNFTQLGEYGVLAATIFYFLKRHPVNLFDVDDEERRNILDNALVGNVSQKIKTLNIFYPNNVSEKYRFHLSFHKSLCSPFDIIDQKYIESFFKFLFFVIRYQVYPISGYQV